MKKKKELMNKRFSNRQYPTRNCNKTDCKELFIPTDARQIYCCKQHRIDYNNDKRKIADNIESEFTKKVKNNKRILIKILSSNEYKRDSVINESILLYEGYDFSIYHKTVFDSKTKREVKICYEYGILLKDTENKNFKIIKLDEYGH